MKTFIILCSLIPCLSFGQTAQFTADTSRLRSFSGNNQEDFDRALEFEWIINHRPLKFGSTIEDVEVNVTGPDTILFRISKDREWDTIVTKIPPNSINRFNYNACCDYFNAVTEDGNIIKGKVNFQLTGSKTKAKKFLCSIDSYGTFVSPRNAKTISAEWRSPMLPNKYNVEIKEVKTCIGEECQNATLLKEDGSEDPGFYFKTLHQVMILHYMPLSTDPVRLLVNVDTGVLRIE